MTATVNLRLTGPMDQLRIVWQTGEALLDTVEFRQDPEGTRYNVLVALQEMVTNVLRHAYGGDDSRTIEIEFTRTDDAFTVELRDEGPPFDPCAYDLDALPSADQMPAQVGGYGIMIALTCMDEVDYERRGGRNHLRMTKSVGARTPVTTD